MNENIEQLKKLASPGNPDELFWAQLWDVTNEIEELNNDYEVDPYDRLSRVQTLLEELERPGIFVKGPHPVEVVFFVLTVAQAISAFTWNHLLAIQAAE